jgi:two-component system sensor histidine kinase/response regulator
MSPRPRVLIVDDEPRNLSLLEALLSCLDVDVVAAAGGQEAIDVYARDPAGFDLVLLDVMMPEVDGLTALAAMRRATPRDEHVPIVLVTALSAREDRMRGLEAGADDFLTKPIEPNEVRCRVRTFLALHLAQRQLKQRAKELEKLQQQKAELTTMVVHDLKNPLAVIGSNLGWITKHLRKRGTLDPDLEESLEDAQAGTSRLLALVSGLIDVEKAEAGQLVVMARVQRAGTVLEGIARRYRKEAALRDVELQVEADGALEAPFDADLLARVFENLLENAIRYTPAKGRIVLQARDQGGCLELAVANTGASIPEHLRGSVFEKHTSSEKRRAGGNNLGVGLYFCRLAARAHGGDITLESDASFPTRFVVRIPQARAAEAHRPRMTLAPPAFLD